MLTVCLIFSVFIFWSLVGRALLSVVVPRLALMRSWLISPALGLAVLVLCLMVGNQAGYPIGQFALTLSLVLLVLSLGVLVITRPVFPVKQLLPFVFVLVGACVWVSWPAFQLKFNWISFVTDDYANYCIAADRFREFGFYRSPTINELLGRDYSQYFWFMHGPSLMRFGAEHQLSWLSALTHLRSLQVFMPMIIALGLVQITSAAALIATNNRRLKHALVAAVLLAISPLFIFGMVYQLIAQVGGVALMLALVVLMTHKLYGRSRLRIFMHAVVTAIVASALCMYYPEVTPFAALAIVAYFGWELVKYKALPGARVVLMQYVLILFFVLLRFNVISYIYTLSNQLLGGRKTIDLKLSLFPFFLIPSGLPSLFGLQAMNLDAQDPWASVLILIGAILAISVLGICFKHAIKGYPYAFVLAVQIGLAVSLFRSGSDFGLYKLAMFIQPVLMGACAFLIVYLWRFKIMYFLAAIAAMLMLWVGLSYTRSSAGLKGGIIAEVQHVSDALVNLPKAPSENSYWLSTIDNVIAAKLAADVYQGTYIKFVSREMFLLGGYQIDSDWPLIEWHPHQDMFRRGIELQSIRNKLLFTDYKLFGTKFLGSKEERSPSAYLGLTGDRNLFNRMKLEEIKPHDFFTVKANADVSNLLVFIHSSLGSHYYLGDRKVISYFQQEQDYYDPKSFVNGIGRFFLLRVENPSDSFYLRFAGTKTLMTSKRTHWSSKAIVKGVTDVPLGLIGDGAANTIVGPIKPVKLGVSYYIAIDLGEEAKTIPFHRSGLKAWFNREVPLDYRWLVGFGRDISLLNSQEFETLERPTALKHFPEDIIKARGLEFSGVYEDKWVSPDSKYTFGKANPGDVIEVKLMIPKDIKMNDSHGLVHFKINNQPEIVFDGTPGYYDWILPIKEANKITHLSMAFDRKGNLPKGDDRPVAALLQSIEIVPSSSTTFASEGSARPPTSGVDQDGWSKREVTFDLPVSPKSKEIKLEFEYPGWDSAPKSCEIEVKVDETISRSYTLHAGTNVVTVPIISGSSVKHININTNKDMTLPNPDLRQRSYRLISAEGI